MRPRWYSVSIAPEHAAALRDALELREHGLLDQVGQLLDQVRALQRVLVLQRPNSRWMISWIASARRTDSSVGVVTASS